VVLQSSLPAQSEVLQGFLTRFESLVERTEAALCKLSLVPPLMKTGPSSCPPGELDVGLMEDQGEELYGCFSPRVGDSSLSSLSSLPRGPCIVEEETIAMVASPVLQIMPDLEELCASPTLPISAEHMKVDLPLTSCVRPNSDSPLSVKQLEQSAVSHVPILPPSTHNPDVQFAKELCDLLNKVENSIPGCGRAIACLLTGTTIKDKGKKVSDCSKKKSLRCKNKKSSAIGKALVAA
jgi:hypothetical protein